MRIAAVDVGTNSTRLLICETKGAQRPSELARRLLTTRIGEQMGSDQKLKEKPMLRTIEALAGYSRLCGELGVDRVRVVATSAVRDAANSRFFKELVREKVGWELDIITGEREALLSYSGAIKGLGIKSPGALVIDIGGGSTEFIWNPGAIVSRSFNVGAVRMTEGGHSEEEIKGLLEPVLGLIADYDPTAVIGVGGTATTLAAMDQQLKVYDAGLIHGYRLSLPRVGKILRCLKSLPLEERKQLPGLQPERADIIIAGVTILKIILQELGRKDNQEIIVSETDLLHGLIYEEAGL